MSHRQPGSPLISIEVVEPEVPVPHPEEAPLSKEEASAHLLKVDAMDDDSLVSPQPEAEPFETIGLPPAAPRRRRRTWIGLSLLIGIVGIFVVGTADWVIGLLNRIPVLGIPAVLAAAAFVGGGIGLIVREVLALRRLADVGEVRAAWANADGDRLRQLITRVGRDLEETAGARRAADVVDDAGPDAARRIMSREVLAPRDKQAAAAVASAARQGFVMVTASPSPFLDSALLLARAAHLVRQIAVIYGYRPGAVTLRSLAIAAGRDAGAVAIADAFAQAAAESASRTVEKAGAAVAVMGAGATATGIGAVVGLPVTVLGLAMSVVGKAIGPAGGAVGGGVTAAWRLHRFGLMVLVAARPLPLDSVELDEVKSRTRADVLRLSIRRQ